MKKIQKIASYISGPKAILVFSVAYLILCFAGFNIFTTGTKAVNIYSNIIKITGLLIIVCGIISKRLKFDIQTIIGLFFIVVFFASCFVSMNYGGLFSNLKGILWPLYEIVILFLFCRGKNNDKWFNYFLIILISLSTIFVIVSISYAIAGYIYVPPLINDNFYWGGMATGRLYGFYTDPSYGSIVAITTIYSLVFNYFKNKQIWKIPVFIFLGLLQIIYISLSGSRTALVALLLSMIILFVILFLKLKKDDKLIKKILKSVGVGVLSCCICLVMVFGISALYEKAEPYILKSIGGPISDPSQLFPRQFANEVYEKCDLAKINPEDSKYTQVKNTSTKQTIETDHVGFLGRDESKDISNNRFGLWKSALSVWLTSPIIGAGHNNINNYVKDKLPDSLMSNMNQKTAHNLIFDLLASNGILGLIAIGGLFVTMIISTTKTIKKATKSDSALISISACMALSVLISSMFYPEILYANTIGSVVFWYTLGYLRNKTDNIIGIKNVQLRKKTNDK